jgi:hypothetical protein
MRRTWLNKAWKVTLVLVLLFLLNSAVLASATPGIDWWVIGAGGGSASDGMYALNGTLGQATVGISADDPYRLCAGFWCMAWGGTLPGYTVYLPIVLRMYP